MPTNSKFAAFLRQADEVTRAKPATGTDSEAMEYAENHRTNIFRSAEGAPSRFRDLVPATDPLTEEDFLVSAYLSGSNFEGGAVNKANYQVFMEEFPDHEGVFKLTGGHASYGVAIRLSALDDEILEVLNTLEDYPVLDDDKVSGLESGAIEDAWFSWAHYDFMRALERHLPEAEEEIADMPEPKLHILFDKLKSRVGAEWVIESSGNAYIEVSRIAEAATADDLT